MGSTKDYSGQKFGKLLVLEKTDKRKYNNVVFRCLCDCGNICEVNSGRLVSGNRKSCGCLSKLPEGEAAFNFLYDHYKRGAISRNLEWDLDKEQFKVLTKGNCHYCGYQPSQISKAKTYNGEYIYNGVDRLDNTLGYFLENSVSCCGLCNKAKSALSYEIFIDWLRRF